MGWNKHPSNEAEELRRKAEQRVAADCPSVPRTEAELQRLLHELQVHQVELEMQNTELLQARDEAEKALGKYTDLYDFAPIGYFTLDSGGIVKSANLTGASLLGIERSRLLGQNFGQFVPMTSRPSFSQFLGKVFASQAKEACETQLTTEGDSPFFVQIEALADQSGQMCRIAIINISERRRMEEKIRILHADLARRAADLEAANIELEAFNYSVSHDLRQPLAIINGYCQVIQDVFGNKLDEECQEYIREIHQGTLQMERLIDALLEFACLQRSEMHKQKVDLSAMAKSVAAKLILLGPESLATIHIEPGIVAEGDPDLLRLVLDNLIGNAWKYSGTQEGTFIEFGATEIDGKPVYFVRDNGPGFDMAFADKLFQPFQRLPGTQAEGLGIGLATAERIVKRHGGRIWAESAPGNGATFFVSLEATEPDRDPEAGRDEFH